MFLSNKTKTNSVIFERLLLCSIKSKKKIKNTQNYFNDENRLDFYLFINVFGLKGSLCDNTY